MGVWGSGRRHAVVISLIAILGGGCTAPKIIPSAAFSQRALHTVAILPPDAAKAIPRERLDLIRTALENELTNRGFFVVDRPIIDGACPDPTCTERGNLIKRYPIDAFVGLTIDSASRSNFLAGYYNSISGHLKLTDVEGVQLLDIKHTESERGGLLFNSGQIFQGVISQIRNGDDAAFLTLAHKFAQTVVTSIPRDGKTPPGSVPLAPTIETSSIEERRPAVYEVCATGTPAVFGAIVLKNRSRTDLREIAPGRYCGKYLVADSKQFYGAELELRDAFGTTARAGLGSLPPQTTDSCGGEVGAQISAREIVLQSPCPHSTSRVLVYRAPAPAGPFIKIADVKGTAWRGRSPTGVTSQVLALIAVDRNGLLSEPKFYDIAAKDPI